MRVLTAIHRALSRLSVWAVWLGGTALLLSAIMVTVDVLARKFAGITMSGSDEITGYVFAGATTWAYSYAVLHRSNIRIDAAYNLLPMGLRAVLDIVGLMLLLLFMGYLALKGWDVFQTSWTRNSVAISAMATPLWLPQLVWVVGLGFLNVTLVFLIVHTIVAFAVAGAPAVQALAGTLSVQEEIAEETRGLAEARR